MPINRKYEVSIKTENFAFSEGNGSFEIARILRELADKIENHVPTNLVYLTDINGNKVGYACWRKIS